MVARGPMWVDLMERKQLVGFWALNLVTVLGLVRQPSAMLVSDGAASLCAATLTLGARPI